MNEQAPNKDGHDELLTKEAVAKWFQVSTRMVDYLMATGALPFVKLGRRTVRFRRQDVLLHLETRRNA
jgi:excisionase family DNA binding protein